jgi:hypothetical protein
MVEAIERQCPHGLRSSGRAQVMKALKQRGWQLDGIDSAINK